jgi:hypothetical protein
MIPYKSQSGQSLVGFIELVCVIVVVVLVLVVIVHV